MQNFQAPHGPLKISVGLENIGRAGGRYGWVFLEEFDLQTHSKGKKG